MKPGTKIAPLQRDEIPELSRFLVDGFGVAAATTCFSHDVLAWKYFDGPNGPTDDSTCSLVARSANRIVGHIGICRRQFIVAGNAAPPISTMHAIDWLGSSEHAGTGSFLMLQALASCQTQYAVGGSAQAQAVFPRLGFERKRRLAVYRKVLAPFHRLRTTGQSRLRKWAGVAKDLISVYRAPTLRPTHPVELRQVTAFTPDIDVLIRHSATPLVTCQRDHALLNYFLRCPLPGFSGWTIHLDDRLIGCAVLKLTPHGRVQQGKLIDCWLATDDPACWHSAVAALINQLRALSADVVTCYGATPPLEAALLATGFAKSDETNVFVRDKHHLLPADAPVALSMFEADHAIV